MVFSKSLPILSLFVSDDITGGDACDAVRDDIGIIAHHTDGCNLAIAARFALDSPQRRSVDSPRHWRVESMTSGQWPSPRAILRSR